MPFLRRAFSIILFIAIVPLAILLAVAPGPWAILFMPFVLAYSLYLWDAKRFPYKKTLRAFAEMSVSPKLLIPLALLCAAFFIWLFIFKPQ